MSVGILTAVTAVFWDMTTCNFVTGTRILGSLSLLSLPVTSTCYPDDGRSLYLRNIGNEIQGITFKAAVVSIRKDDTEEVSI